MRKGWQNRPSAHRRGLHRRSRAATASTWWQSRAASFTMGSPADEPERQPNSSRSITSPWRPSSSAPHRSPRRNGSRWSWRIHRIETRAEPRPSFFRGTDLPVESISWYEADRILPKARGDHRPQLPAAERSPMGICLPRRNATILSTSGRRSPPSLRTIAARWRGVRRQRRPEHRVQLLRRRQIWFGRLRPRAGRHFSRNDDTRRHVSARTGSASTTCTAMSGNSASTSRAKAMTTRPVTAAPIWPDPRAPTGSCAVDRGRTTRRSAVRPIVIGSHLTIRGGRAALACGARPAS